MSTTTTTATTYTCRTWMRAGRACGRPATMAWYVPAERQPYTPVCDLHIGVRQRSRWPGQPPVQIAGEVAEALAADAAARAASQAEADAREAARAAEQRASVRARQWNEADLEWVVVRADDAGYDYATATEYQRPRWLVQVADGATSWSERWEVRIEPATIGGDMPAEVRIYRTGSLTPAASRALALALVEAAAVAEQITAQAVRP